MRRGFGQTALSTATSTGPNRTTSLRYKPDRFARGSGDLDITLLRSAYSDPTRARSRLWMAAPGFLDSLSPWTSKSATPKPVGDLPPPQLGQWQGADHRVDHRTRFGPRDYPEDCPMLNTRWFYAVDVSSQLENTSCSHLVNLQN